MNAQTEATVLVTGASGILGTRLLSILGGTRIIAVDLRPPVMASYHAFESVDLGREPSTRRLIELIRETGANAVVHLASAMNLQRTGVLDTARMWQINVAGTGRVMEAITEVNRRSSQVRKFIFASSVSVYGSETAGPVTEGADLRAHTLPYAVQKMECDRVVQYRANSLGDCSTYLLRPHIYTGTTAENYLVGALRGTPTGTGKRAEDYRRRDKRMRLMLPLGRNTLTKLFQFVHMDDVARLIAYILWLPEQERQNLILNVAGRGEAVTLAECAEIAHAKIIRLPRAVCDWVLQRLWDRGISAIPPEAAPYLYGSYTMDTSALQRFLGPDYYPRVIQYTVREALADSFAPAPGIVSETPA